MIFGEFGSPFASFSRRCTTLKRKFSYKSIERELPFVGDELLFEVCFLLCPQLVRNEWET